MGKKLTLLWAGFLLLATSGAWADEPGLPPPADEAAREAAQSLPAQAADGLGIAASKTAGLPAEATIRLMDEADAELPDAVMNDLALPELPETSRGADGLATAEENTGRRGIGQDVASGALENARDNANSMAEDALENVEQRGRSGEHGRDDPPGPKGPPDTPAP